MIRRTRDLLKLATIGTAVALSACGSGDEGVGASDLTFTRTAGAQVLARIRGGRAEKGKRPVINPTREQLEETNEPALQVNPEIRGGSDFLRLVGRRKDDTPGTIKIWSGSDNTQLYLRNGVLVGSRGVGGDIISSDANAVIRALSAGRSGNGERRYSISDGAYGSANLALSCDIDNLGQTTTQVVHLRYATTHLRETCVGGEGDKFKIVNEYWVQPGSGTVRRSRQWAGPLSGYFEMILLID